MLIEMIVIVDCEEKKDNLKKEKNDCVANMMAV